MGTQHIFHCVALWAFPCPSSRDEASCGCTVLRGWHRGICHLVTTGGGTTPRGRPLRPRGVLDVALPVRGGETHSPGQVSFRVSFSFSGYPPWSRGGHGSRFPAGCVGTLVVKACGSGRPAGDTLGQSLSGELGGRGPRTSAVGWACLILTRGKHAGPAWPPGLQQSLCSG